ncbi:MAG TPA: RsmE family RNA methyltransferase [Acidimicrobiia bacterium]
MPPHPEPPANPAAEPGIAAHLFVDDGRGLHDELDIGGADGHHLQRARRIAAGEELTVADGDGRWRRYRVDGVGKGSLHLVASGGLLVEAPPRYEIVAAPALISRSRFDGVVAQLTELGVDAIVPLVSERCVTRWDRGDPATVTARLRAVAREAAMQCRRSRVPRVDAPATPSQIASRGARVVVTSRDARPHECDDDARPHEFGDARRAARAPSDSDGPSETRAIVVVSGPEGGFSARDMTDLGEHICLCLGAYVLRAETAPIAAVALLTERRDRRDAC